MKLCFALMKALAFLANEGRKQTHRFSSILIKAVFNHAAWQAASSIFTIPLHVSSFLLTLHPGFQSIRRVVDALDVTIQRLSGQTSDAMLRHYQSVDYDDLRRITNAL